MSKVRIVLWDEPTGREEIVETVFDDAAEAFAHYHSGNGSCECIRAFADETWNEGDALPECGFGRRWVLDVIRPNGEPMGSPDGHLLAMPPRETPSDAFEASPAFRAKMAEREALLRAATGTTDRCDRCFAFYYPKHIRVGGGGEIEVHTIGFLCGCMGEWP